MSLVIILLAVAGLSFANGANDNFKGVATLFGSGTAAYRGALVWATLTTALGSLAAFVLAEKLLKAFSGRGLVPNELVADPTYVAAVAAGAGMTVLIATRFGLPISTTHGLVGALVGTGWAAGATVNLATLQSTYFWPLLLSPCAAIMLTGACYPLFHRVRQHCGLMPESCFCVGSEVVEISPGLGSAAALLRAQELSVQVGSVVACQSRYAGRLVGIEAGRVLDVLHYLSAGAVSFARGLNDTPKIAALLLVTPAIGKTTGIVAVAIVIALGGLLSAKRVARTMSTKITPMNPGQGFTANLVTATLVILASRWGWPVSTTHVSCGSLFGIGTVTGQARWSEIAKILTAWVTTLPAGAASGALAYMAMH